MSKIDSLLELFGAAPADQIDPTIAKRLKSLSGASNEIVATELQEIIELCEADKKLVSNFAINIIDSAKHVVSVQDQV